MRAIIQRVSYAKVTVDNKIVGEIEKGLLVFLGVGDADMPLDLDYITDKVTNMRIFEDLSGKMNLSVKDINGEMLAVSQFTLYGDVRRGRRPSFSSAAQPDIAKEHYEMFIQKCRSAGVKKVEQGVFGADMKVEIINDGPVTIMLDSKRTF